MSKSNKIYPLAYRLAPEQTCTVYYLGFPEAWKQKLLTIARENNIHFKEEYGLPTNTLKKLVSSWMEGIVSLAALKKDSVDEHWLTACHPYSADDIEELCGIIRTWIKTTYALNPKASPLTKKLANEFCGQMQAEELAKMQTAKQVRLTASDGTVSDEAYEAIPILAGNRLLGQEIELHGQTLHFSYAAKNQLISQPITEPRSGHQYSFVLELSVQTTPPRRKALLLCHMRIRRWIPDRYEKEKTPFLRDSINAHIRVSPDKYCQVPILYDRKRKRPDWRAPDRDCYNILGHRPLPEAEAVLKDPAAYAQDILLPFKIGMKGFTEPVIGTGVPVVDKAALYPSVAALLGDMIDAPPSAERVTLRGQTLSTFASPQEYESAESFRQWVSQCAETDSITFELYGLWKDPVQKQLLQQLQEKIEQDFGADSSASCLTVRCVPKEVKDLSNSLTSEELPTQIARINEIVEELGQTDAATACIFVLPGGKDYAAGGDPKQVLRNAFALTGRLVQFITPDSEVNQNRINNTVYDLYRQLGVVTLLNPQKLPSMASVPCVGMYVYTQVRGISGKARFMPLYVTVDVPTGKTRVQCEAFSSRTVPYRQACLEMAKLFWHRDLEQRCVNAGRAPAKQKLIELKNQYCTPADRVLFMVQADGNTRALWGGISDKEIGGYPLADTDCPEKINVGMPKNPYLFPLAGSGVRIIRLRSNQEVPDYFTEPSVKSTPDNIQYAASSGIFRYEDTYWGIHIRPNDPQYKSSYKKSKIDYPKQRFAEKDMVEFYPLQLQPGDHAAEWIFYANALRQIPIQYNQATVLPLPLHLAKALEEYLFCI